MLKHSVNYNSLDVRNFLKSKNKHWTGMVYDGHIDQLRNPTIEDLLNHYDLPSLQFLCYKDGKVLEDFYKSLYLDDKEFVLYSTPGDPLGSGFTYEVYEDYSKDWQSFLAERNNTQNSNEKDLDK